MKKFSFSIAFIAVMLSANANAQNTHNLCVNTTMAFYAGVGGVIGSGAGVAGAAIGGTVGTAVGYLVGERLCPKDNSEARAEAAQARAEAAQARAEAAANRADN